MITNSTVETAQESPVVLWAIIIALVLAIIVSQMLPKLRQALDSARRIAADKDDADIADLNRKVDYLTRTVNDMRRRQIDHDEVLVIHRSWDQAVMNDPEYATKVAPPALYPTHHDEPQNRPTDTN